MSFPITDWQFWLVTLVAGLGLWQLIKQFLPSPSSSQGCRGCDTCATEQSTATPSKLVVLGGGQRTRRRPVVELTGR